MFTVKPLNITLRRMNKYIYEAVVDGIQIGGVSTWLYGQYAAYMNVDNQLRSVIPHDFDTHAEAIHDIDTPREALADLLRMIGNHFIRQGFTPIYHGLATALEDVAALSHTA